MIKRNLIPLLFIVFVFVSCRNPEPADFLIPKGYSGRVAVVFEQKQGEKPKYANGRRLYEIPPNGILLTQFKAEFGTIDYRYFLVGEKGNKILLPIFDDSAGGTTKDREKIGILGHGTTVAFTEPGNDPTHMVFNQPALEFFVSTLNGIDTVESMGHFNQRVDSLIESKNSR